jgi:hypothetical protein
MASTFETCFICKVNLVKLKSSSLILSKQFTFFIGKDETAIVVHADAIAATSPQLYALINGGMEESASRCVTIEDVRVDDFVRFCEYAYRGTIRYLRGKRSHRDRAL